MASILHQPENDGTETNLDDLEKQIRNSAIAPPGSKPEGTPKPDKFANKSREEILEAYQNLESIYGRQASEFGQLKKLADEVIALKRSAAAPETPKPVERPKLSTADLLDDPDAALEKWYAARAAEERQAYEQRIAQLEGAIAQTTLVTRHSDLEQITSEPEFATWVQASPTRVRAARAAAGGDVGAANDLITEYKAQRTQRRQAVDEGTRTARTASFEGSGSGERPATTAKRYKRADLIRLKIERPDVYADPSFQAEILRAYAEKRVD